MQTFLPYPSFTQSAKVLDRQRLGKQRVECLQILKALHNPVYGWQNHPATQMWRGYEHALITYGLMMCAEWIKRGYKDTCYNKIDSYQLVAATSYGVFPTWFGSADFHLSHQSNLLRKAPAWYSQFGWTVPNDLPYVWPV